MSGRSWSAMSAGRRPTLTQPPSASHASKLANETRRSFGGHNGVLRKNLLYVVAVTQGVADRLEGRDGVPAAVHADVVAFHRDVGGAHDGAEEKGYSVTPGGRPAGRPGGRAGVGVRVERSRHEPRGGRVPSILIVCFHIAGIGLAADVPHVL